MVVERIHQAYKKDKAYIKRYLQEKLSDEKPKQPKSRAPAGHKIAFLEDLEKLKDRHKLYKIYTEGGEVAAAIDTYALFTVSDKARLVTEDTTEQELLDDYVKGIDFSQFLKEYVVWALVYGDAVFEKIRNVANTKILSLKYIDGRTTKIIVNDKNQMDGVNQITAQGLPAIPFKPNEVVVGILIPDSNSVTGISLLNRNMDNIKRKVKIDEGITQYIDRHGFPKYQIKQSSAVEGQPIPDQAQRDNEATFQDISANNEFLTTDLVEIVPLDTGGKAVVKEFSEYGINLLTSGLGVPEEMLGMGRGSTEATANVRMKAFEFNINAYRNLINSQLQRQLFLEIRGDLGLVGEINLEFPDINPETELNKATWIEKVEAHFNEKEIREILGFGERPEEEIIDVVPEEIEEDDFFDGFSPLDILFEKAHSKKMCSCKGCASNLKALQAANKKRPDNERTELTNKFQLPLRRNENRLINNVFTILDEMEEILISDVVAIVEGKSFQTPLQDATSAAVQIDIPPAQREALTQALTAEMGEAFTVGLGAAFADLNTPFLGGLSDSEAIVWLEQQASLISNQTLDKAIIDMRFQIMEGLRNGESVAQVSDRMSQVFEGTRKDMDRIARTELQRAANEGRLDGYERLGVQQAEFLVTDDDRTCAECLALDGLIMPISEARNLIPVHPNCRCTFMPVTTTSESQETLEGMA